MIKRYALNILLFLSLIGCGSSSKQNFIDDKGGNFIVKTSNTTHSIAPKTKKETPRSTKKIDDTQISKSPKKIEVIPVLEYNFDLCDLKSGVIDQQNSFEPKQFGNLKLTKSLFNNALSFNGKDSYLKLPTMDVDYSNGFSFSAWVKFDKKAKSGKNWETIFSFGNNDKGKAYKDKHKSEIWLNRYYNENKLYFAFTNGDRDNLCGDIKTKNDVLKPGTFQHIVATIDENNYPHIYIDGKEAEVEVAWHNRGGACELPSVKRDLCYIGKPNDEWMGFDSDGGIHDHKDNNLFDGEMDEVKVYNVTLKSDEIAKLYKFERDSKREPLICESTPLPKPTPQPTPKPTPTPTPAPTQSIVIDANIDDWKNIKGFEKKNSLIKAYTDSTYLYLLFKTDLVKDPQIIWFIDSDNDPKSGHQASDWQVSGADYAIGTSGKLYISKSNDSQWIWDNTTLGDVDKFVSKNGVVELKVKKDQFHLSNKFRVGVRVEKNPDSLPFPPKEMLIVKNQNSKIDPFDKIKSVLNKQGSTYICVGDSTRADDPRIKNNQVFNIIKSALSSKTYSILEAHSGVSAKTWATTSLVDDVIADIQGSGEDSVVNISLGINDVKEGESKEEIVSYLQEGINKILSSRPKTHIILTMPNLLIGIDSNPFVEAYLELANSYPLIDTRDIFQSGDLSLYRDADANDYGDNIRIHLSDKAQELIAKRILRMIKN